MKRTRRRTTTLTLMTAMALCATGTVGGCETKDSSGSGEDSEGAGSETGDAPGSDGDPSGGAGSDGASGTSTSGGGGSESSGDDSTSDSTGASFVGGTTSGGSEPGPNGTECISGADCDSTKCFSVGGFGAFCSECETDADCMMGGAGTCGFDAGLGYAVCQDGAPGDMCGSDEGCMGDLICGAPFGEGLGFNFCSECNTTDDCDSPQLCANIYSEGLGAYLGCVDPGSVEDGQGCPLDGTEGVDDACVSGKCGVVNLFGMLPVGLCGECNSDADCNGGTCTPGEFGMAGRVPSSCSGGGTGGGDTTSGGGTTGGGSTGGGSTGGGSTGGGSTGGTGATGP